MGSAAAAAIAGDLPVGARVRATFMAQTSSGCSDVGTAATVAEHGMDHRMQQEHQTPVRADRRGIPAHLMCRSARGPVVHQVCSLPLRFWIQGCHPPLASAVSSGSFDCPEGTSAARQGGQSMDYLAQDDTSAAMALAIPSPSRIRRAFAEECQHWRRLMQTRTMPEGLVAGRHSTTIAPLRQRQIGFRLSPVPPVGCIAPNRLVYSAPNFTEFRFFCFRRLVTAAPPPNAPLTHIFLPPTETPRPARPLL